MSASHPISFGIGVAVRHLNGRVGRITRDDGGPTVSVRFPNTHRTSVVLRQYVKLTPASECTGCFRCTEEAEKSGARVYYGMFICPTCGNKRCPRASDHLADCMGSLA
jgi:hypothetical protein